MFGRVLVANRGEIAVRIIHACREQGIEPITIYSDADRDALHVRLAGEAIRVGGPPAGESYLNQEAIVAAARAFGAEAIHPGYGFLSESAEFARRCRESGFVFVGPPTEAIRRMADKAEAKSLARSLAIPVVEGYEGSDQSANRFAREAERIGYPVLVKAALGGGGKGMHVVESPSTLQPILDQARREASTSFADTRLILERYILRPRHIEIQVLGDQHGRLMALGERDCSSQRRHQKVIEEAPAPAIDLDTRRRLADFALRFAASIDYYSTGTVEFLLDADGSCYFLEMNTRLQVEHAVTEAVFGVDLVRLQLEVAAGQPLRLPASPPSRGHAIECRIYAEDPRKGFLPSTGRLLALRVPEGAGVRNDLGVSSGDEIGPYYDPLLAKLTTWGEDRDQAIGRMRRALEEYLVLGVHTNLTLLQDTIRAAEFAGGYVDTGFLERERDRSSQVPPPGVFCAASARALSVALAGDGRADPWKRLGSWRLGGQQVPFCWLQDEREYEVRAWRQQGERTAWRLECGGEEFSWFPGGDLGRIILLQGRHSQAYDVAGEGLDTWVALRGRAWVLRPAAARTPTAESVNQPARGDQRVEAPMPGLVARVNVREGEHVDAHQVLIVLEAMKMQHAIEALTAGVVRKLHCSEGDLVAAGARLLDLEAAS